MEIIFFAGKGGVGKTTCASLFAYKLASRGYRVFLNSIDPAHNLHDIFNCRLGSKPKEIAKNLTVMETDLDYWVKKYLKETERDFKETYKYQEAFNLHRYFKTLKYSPGLEEYALLLALRDSISRYRDCDYIVFDTPPTALTLKFMALPSVSLLWLEELMSFRQMILNKKEIITKIKTGKKKTVKENDPILARIEGLIETYKKMAGQFVDKKMTKVFLVLNPDTLSLSESKDIKEKLKDLNISIPYVVLNKIEEGNQSIKDIENEFGESKIIHLLKREREIIGTDDFDIIDLSDDIDFILGK